MKKYLKNLDCFTTILLLKLNCITRYKTEFVKYYYFDFHRRYYM